MSAADLSGFPVHLLHPDRELYRIHRVGHDPLWYATAESPGVGGRFDLPAGSRAGTCYLAVSPLGAFLEKFGRLSVITTALIDAHRLNYVAPTAPLHLADVTDRAVLGEFRVAGDISVGTDYGPPQELAARLWEAGFDGVFYAARHDPSFTERSVAVFGASETADEPKGFDVTTGRIPRTLIDEAEQNYHLRVIPGGTVADTDI